MDREVRERDGVAILELNGRLVDGGADRELREAVEELVDSGRVRILLDLRGLTSIDSCGLGELVASGRRVREAGGALRALYPQERVLRVLDLTRVLPLFELFETEDAGIESFRRGARKSAEA